MTRFHGTATGTEGDEKRTWELGPYDSEEDAQRDGQAIVDNPASAFFEPSETINAIAIVEIGGVAPVFEWVRK